MGVRLNGTSLKQVLGGLGIVSLSALLNGFLVDTATAQSTVQVFVEDGEIVELPTLRDEFEDTFFTQDQDFYENRRFPRTLIPIFGIIENDIGGDARRVNELYEDALEQQITPDQFIRVADLPNPFTGSLGTTPLYVEEPLPPAPIPIQPPRPEPRLPGVQPQPQPEVESVPALW